MRGARGFSLVEIMIVIAILGLSAVVVAPAMRDWGVTSDLDSARKEVLRVLMASRQEALKLGRPVLVAIEPASARLRVWVEVESEETLLLDRILDLPMEAHLESAVDTPRFRFTPLGPAEADPLTIVSPDGTAKVTVDPWTGGIDHGRR